MKSNVVLNIILIIDCLISSLNFDVSSFPPTKTYNGKSSILKLYTSLIE